MYQFNGTCAFANAYEDDADADAIAMDAADATDDRDATDASDAADAVNIIISHYV